MPAVTGLPVEQYRAFCYVAGCYGRWFLHHYRFAVRFTVRYRVGYTTSSPAV
jgi:hypothetical protein